MYLGTIEKQASEVVAHSINYDAVLAGRVGTVTITEASVEPSADLDKPVLVSPEMADASTYSFLVSGGPVSTVMKKYLLTVKADIVVAAKTEKVEDEIVIVILPTDALCAS